MRRSAPSGTPCLHAALRGLPSPSEDLERRRAFETAYPDVTISPPETHANLWTARRGGKILASGYQLGDLLDSLDWLLGQPARVITVWQPYAWAIVAGVKTTEDRTWATTYRGLLYIHAGQEIDLNAPAEMRPPGGRLIAGAILGDVILARVEGDPGAWRWILTDPVALAEPLAAVRGHPGLWLLDLPPGLR